ncbi:CotH kinase family protein [Myxococcaceae bacterium JPH2]|nr:CotH kinase family protein [Myxococcaceae bacterium JPH2]
MRAVWSWCGVGVLFLAACSGSPQTEDEGGPPPDGMEEPAPSTPTGGETGTELPPAELPPEEPDDNGPSPSTEEPPPDSQSAAPEWPALQTQIETYELRFDKSTWDFINDPAHDHEYAPGHFLARGVDYTVGLRLRGEYAREHPKLSWKVKLPDGSKLDGAKKFNFMAEWLDAGNLSDVFSYEMMTAGGAQAPRARYVMLNVNGKLEGLFTQVEQVDKAFLRSHHIDEDANIYRCGARDCEMTLAPIAHYQDPWSKETNEDQPWDDLHAFLDKLAHTPEHEFEAFARDHLDLDAYLRYLAVGIVIGIHGIDDSGSFLIHDRVKDRWTYAPWDLNNSVLLYWRTERVGASPETTRAIPAYTAYDSRTIRTYEHKQAKYGGAHFPFSVLNQRIWDRPVFRNKVLDYVDQLMATVFTQESASKRIDAQYALVKDQLARDPYVARPQAAYSPEYLKRYVAGRRTYLTKNLPLERHRGEGGVVINSFGALPLAPVGANGEVEGYVELYNRESTPAPVSGLIMTNVIRDQYKYKLPPNLVVPPKGVLRLLADGKSGTNHLPFKLSTKGGELALFDGKTMTGVIDLTYYAPLSPGKSYGRIPDGAETWNWK